MLDFMMSRINGILQARLSRSARVPRCRGAGFKRWKLLRSKLEEVFVAECHVSRSDKLLADLSSILYLLHGHHIHDMYLLPRHILTQSLRIRYVHST